MPLPIWLVFGLQWDYPMGMKKQPPKRDWSQTALDVVRKATEEKSPAKTIMKALASARRPKRSPKLPNKHHKTK